MDLEKMIKEIHANLNTAKKIVVFCDDDGDGISSGHLLTRVLSYLNKNFEVFVANFDVPKDNIVKFAYKKIKEEKVDTIISVDLPLDVNEIIELLDKTNRKWIYIDHHQREKFKHEKLVFADIRAEKIEPFISCAEFSYIIGKRIIGKDFIKFAPIAAAGAYQDYLLNQNTELYKDIIENYPEFINENVLNPQFLTYILMLLAFGEEPKLFILGNPEEPHKFLQTFRYEFLKGINKFAYSLSDFKVEEREKITILWTKGNSSIVASYLPIRTIAKNKILVVLSPKYDSILNRTNNFFEYYKVSLRTTLNIDLGKIMKELSNKFNGKGGGHEKAAGGIIPKNKIDEFLEELEKFI